MVSNNQVVGLTLVLVLVSLSTNSAETPSNGENWRQMQNAMTAPLVDYCRINSPETKAAVDAGYVNYVSTLDAAINLWKSPFPQLFKPGVTQAEKNAFLSGLSKDILATAKQYEPQKYCAWLANSLKSATPDTNLKLLRDYEARARDFESKKARQ